MANPSTGVPDVELSEDARGGVTVEYAVLLVLVAVGAAAAVAGLGPVLARVFVSQQTWLSLGVP